MIQSRKDSKFIIQYDTSEMHTTEVLENENNKDSRNSVSKY
jgi:hypothetical protein